MKRRRRRRTRTSHGDELQQHPRMNEKSTRLTIQLPPLCLSSSLERSARQVSKRARISITSAYTAFAIAGVRLARALYVLGPMALGGAGCAVHHRALYTQAVSER